MKESRGPSIFLSLLLALVGAGCLVASVWLMPWDEPVQDVTPPSEPVRRIIGAGQVAVGTTGDEIRLSSAHEGADSLKRLSPAGNGSSSSDPDPVDASPGKIDELKVENAKAARIGEPAAEAEIASVTGPWTIELSPDNYSITAKGWETIKEVRTLLLSNKDVRLSIVGTANIMRSKKRAAHAAKILRDRISQEHPQLFWRMTISGELSDAEQGLVVSVKVMGGGQ